MLQFSTMGLRILAAAVFLVCAGTVFWWSLVHTVHLGTQSIPDLRGITLEEAERRAHDLGLRVAAEEPGVFSSTSAPGQVAAQEPYPGFHVKTGATVRVRLSLGSERATVPDLRGQSLQAAQQVMEQLGLRVGRRARLRCQLEGEGILATEPAAGSEVPPATEVAVLVNVTPARQVWVMPSLIQRPLAQVRAFCQDNRLRLGQVHEVAYPGLLSGLVLRQYPAAGSQLSRSDIITLWVSR
jgi:beta-lactam-binding protein with PASTA domain